MIKESRAYRYAKWCVSRGNRKVGKYVKLQARKWLKIADGRHKKAYISEKSYRKICKLLKLMVHPDLHCSMYDGLEDYAWFLIVAVFCTRCREDDRRFYQTAILEIARKNFKTFNSAVIFILGMLTEPRFSGSSPWLRTISCPPNCGWPSGRSSRCHRRCETTSRSTGI